MRRIQIIDSHTGGEPTRTVIAGGPDLGQGSMAERREIFRTRFDSYRSAIVNEPRGSDVIVGALLCEPVDPSCVAGAIFFNNVGMLHMCGHGTIGLAVTLAHMGRIGVGVHKLETNVGVVTFEYHGENRVTLENVPSYRYRADVKIEVPESVAFRSGVVGGSNEKWVAGSVGFAEGPEREPNTPQQGHAQSLLTLPPDAKGRSFAERKTTLTGDIAWGGNWFFLVKDYPEPIELSRVERLSEVSRAIRRVLDEQKITGADGGEIDHIELFGPPANPHNHSRNFVLCPGSAYDRSPCGTGTSAKLACLAADGKLAPGEVWRQESILGSVFEGSYRPDGAKIIPRITGTAYVNAEATLLLDPRDPFEMGIRVD